MDGTWLGVVPLNATNYVDQNGTRLNYTNVKEFYKALDVSGKPVEPMPTNVAIMQYSTFINGKLKSGVIKQLKKNYNS